VPARLPVRAYRPLGPATTLEGVFEVARTVRFAEPPGGIAATVVYVTEGGDKYASDTVPVEIDCAARLPLCHAACCRLRVPLTRQDLDEGVVQWDADRPYLNRQRADGYCVHCDPVGHRCHVYERRPGLCRTYDCRNDRRIWIDFEGRIPNPAVTAMTGDTDRGGGRGRIEQTS
jgi:hypothetical protein